MAAVARNSALTRILLSGSLAQRFGREHLKLLETGSVWEALKALQLTVCGFKEEVEQLARGGLRFAIVRNRSNVSSDRDFRMAGTRELRIVPVIEGSKRAGVLQTVVGIVLIVASFFVAPGSQAALFAAGVGTTAGGVIQLLSPQASGLRQSASPENLPSYAFGSARNTTASGNNVPICIGERRWGGAIISAAIYAEDKV